MSDQALQNDNFDPPEIQIRSSHLVVLALSMTPLIWAFWSGPIGTVHAQILSNRSHVRLFQYDPGSILIHLAQQIPYGFWILVLAQSLSMSMVVLAVSATADRLFPSKYASFWASLLLVASGEWTRWSALISPDPLPNSLGILGSLAWIYTRWNRTCPNRFAKLIVVEALIGAGVLSGFWKMVALAAFTDLVVQWLYLQIDLQKSKSPALPVLIVALISVSILIPQITLKLVAQTPQNEVLPGQVVGGYPDFHVRDTPGKVSPVFVGGVRVAMELAQIRPSYSWRHNAAIVFITWPVLVLSLVGLWKNRAAFWMLPIGVICALWAIMVGLSYADWDSRFLSSIWPLCALMASGVAHSVIFSRLFFRTLIALAISGSIALIFHHPILLTMGKWLVVDDSQPADVLVILVGGDPDRDRLTANLFTQGFAPQIWLANDRNLLETDFSNDAGNVIRRLTAAGVPRERITLLPTARNTTSEAQRVAEHVQSLDPGQRPRSITVVTTSFHTRRARILFRKYLSGTGVVIHTAASYDPAVPTEGWWRQRHSRSMFTGEFAKILFSLLGLG
jgi:uncharacterized SAM-binding protein YcdF (DUF218 family)